MNLARALYIPAILVLVIGILSLITGDAKNAALAGILGTLCGLLGFCAAVRDAGLINVGGKASDHE